VHAVVGENGAGKTTLARILAGLTDCDHGKMWLDGEEYSPKNVTDAMSAGISLAAQEPASIDNLSVAENIGLRQIPNRYGVIDRVQLDLITRKALDFVGSDILDSNIKCRDLNIADRQLVELGRVLADTSCLVILDEPTASLTQPQTERIHKILRDLAANGTSIIYISHRLADVLDVADIVSVLRDGQIVLSEQANLLTTDHLVAAMAGEGLKRREAMVCNQQKGRPLLRIESIATENLAGPISVTGCEGEIIGLAGLAGSGRSELLHAAFRAKKLTQGRIVRIAETKEVELKSSYQAVNNGVAFLGADRVSMSLFPGQSVKTNMMLPGDRKNFTPFRRIDRRKERKSTKEIMTQLDIRCSSVEQDIDELSGGNQQKTILGRWLNSDADVLLLNEPTRGVDTRTKKTIYDLIFELRNSGKCIFVVSSEIEELFLLASRILVLSNRKVVREFERNHWTETAILTAAFSEFTKDFRQEAGE